MAITQKMITKVYYLDLFREAHEKTCGNNESNADQSSTSVFMAATSAINKLAEKFYKDRIDLETYKKGQSEISTQIPAIMRDEMDDEQIKNLIIYGAKPQFSYNHPENAITRDEKPRNMMLIQRGKRIVNKTLGEVIISNRSGFDRQYGETG